MDGYTYFYIGIGVLFLYLIIDDIRGGEYQFIKGILELVLVYTPIVLLGLGYIFYWDYVAIFAVLMLIYVLFILGGGRKIITEKLEKMLPPKDL